MMHQLPTNRRPFAMHSFAIIVDICKNLAFHQFMMYIYDT